ncbi:putative signal transducing protein [Kineobactrum salinum]|uniref:DUF2007 domain-containing protein n=1 Tax=Kineobactrum salinum TaxID=2708301 RepID=A0A6C0U188_9GAMM|nr:DUF2007 domain-containing protein [Kineobactrum salinum]QIB65329.1 DUF2007 domain-containing protein [Kineobactrum salinum]
MNIIYRASDILEAHIVAGMLKADGIDAYVGGHYLQGAVGELSPMGYANVFVDDEDTDAALSIIKEYEQNSSEPVQDEVVAGSCKPA